jgi:5-methylcytosine-specific restriction endonuclease McrA
MRHQGTWDGITDQEILERDRWMCWLCKRRIGKTFRYPHPRSASIDHIVPLSRDGDDTAFNKRAAHLGCNMARGNGRRGEQMTLNFGAA